MTTRPAPWTDPDWCDDHADEVLDEIRSGDRQPPVGWLMSPRREVADLRRRVDQLKQQMEAGVYSAENTEQVEAER